MAGTYNSILFYDTIRTSHRPSVHVMHNTPPLSSHHLYIQVLGLEVVVGIVVRCMVVVEIMFRGIVFGGMVLGRMVVVGIAVSES